MNSKLSPFFKFKDVYLYKGNVLYIDILQKNSMI